MAAIWADLLGGGSPGAHDDFFDLGGHSLLATQVLVRVHDALQVELPIRQVFLGPTVAEMAHAVDAARSAGPDEATEPIQPVARRTLVETEAGRA